MRASSIVASSRAGNADKGLDTIKGQKKRRKHRSFGMVAIQDSSAVTSNSANGHASPFGLVCSSEDLCAMAWHIFPSLRCACMHSGLGRDDACIAAAAMVACTVQSHYEAKTRHEGRLKPKIADCRAINFERERAC